MLLYRARTTRTSELSRSDQGVTRGIGRTYQVHTSEGPVALVYSLSNVYRRENEEVTLEFVTRLGHDLQDESCSPEVRSLGRTLLRSKHQIAAWHEAQITNSPTEAINNFIKRVKRSAFGFRNFRTYRIRALLNAGRPSWSLLATVTPRQFPMSRQSQFGQRHSIWYFGELFNPPAFLASASVG